MPSCYVTSHSGQLSLLPSAGREMSSDQGAVAVLCGREGNRRSDIGLAVRNRLYAMSTYTDSLGSEHPIYTVVRSKIPFTLLWGNCRLFQNPGVPKENVLGCLELILTGRDSFLPLNQVLRHCMNFYRTRWTAEGSVFGAVSLCFFACVWNISGTAERICAKFTRKTCLIPRSDDFWRSEVKGQGHQGQRRHFSSLSVACVWFMFGKTSLASSYGRSVE